MDNLNFEKKERNFSDEKLTEMINEIRPFLNIRNSPWSLWEKEFLTGVVNRRSSYGFKATFTPKQQYYIENAYKKI